MGQLRGSIIASLLVSFVARAKRFAGKQSFGILTSDELMDLSNDSNVQQFLEMRVVPWGRPTEFEDCLSVGGELIGEGSFGRVYSVSVISGGEATGTDVAVKVQEKGQGLNHEIAMMERLHATRDTSYVWIAQSLASGVGMIDGQKKQYYWTVNRRSMTPQRTHRMVAGKIPKGILVMEKATSDLSHYTPNHNGRSWVRKRPLSPVAALNLFVHAMYGLRAMHDSESSRNKRGLTHGDLKPENILVFGNCYEFGVYPDGDCFAKIGDLGSALKEGDTRRNRGRNDMYDAPEQRDSKTAFAKAFPARPAADMWAMGLILFELIFQEGTPMIPLDRVGRKKAPDFAAIDSRMGSLPWPQDWSKSEPFRRAAEVLLRGLLNFNAGARWSARQALVHLAAIGIGNGDGDPPALDPPPELAC